jgi:hypothetical protein
MASLRSQIQSLAESFTAGIIDAIRGASLQELLSEGGGGSAPARRGPGRPRKDAALASGSASNGKGTGGGGQPDPLAQPKSKRKGGRLARRSPSDIAHVIGLIVSTLGEHKAGLRSEQLQKVLKLDKKEITGPLAQALSAKKITKKGQKRSTTYFAK